MQCLDRDPIIKAQLAQSLGFAWGDSGPVDRGNSRCLAKGQLVETHCVSLKLFVRLISNKAAPTPALHVRRHGLIFARNPSAFGPFKRARNGSVLVPTFIRTCSRTLLPVLVRSAPWRSSVLDRRISEIGPNLRHMGGCSGSAGIRVLGVSEATSNHVPLKRRAFPPVGREGTPQGTAHQSRSTNCCNRCIAPHTPDIRPPSCRAS